jgi:DNA repair protein RadC
MRIKELPSSERPRERLLKQGPAALSDAELLALILRTGSKKENVVELSTALLRKFDLKKLSRINVTTIKKRIWNR